MRHIEWTQRTALFVAVCGATFGASSAAGAVVTGFHQTNGTDTLNHTYDPSDTDLINGIAPSASSGNFGNDGGGTGVLTDGAFAPITRGAVAFSSQQFASGGQSSGTSVTYTLAQPSDVGRIDVYGGWQDSGRDEQSYNVLYSTASAPTDFLPLATVDHNPGGPTGDAANGFGTDPGGQPSASLIQISDPSGTLASNVFALRFDFTTTENGYSGYAEIDVLPVPEPTSLGLLGLGGLGLLARRRRD